MAVWFNRIIDGLAGLAALLLCLLVVLICVDVVARSTNLFAIPWSLDMAEYALYLITFFGAPWVLRDDGHIAIEVFVEHFGPRVRAAVRSFTYLIGLVVCAVLLVYSCRQLWRSYSSGNLIYETFVYAEWYQYTVPPVIFLILLLIFVQRLLGYKTAAPEKSSDQPAVSF